MKKVKVSDLETFLRTSSSWLASNPNNQKLEISQTIMKFVFENKDHIIISRNQQGGSDFYLKGQQDIGRSIYERKRESKINLSDAIKVSEISNKPGNDVTEFSFTGDKYKEVISESEKIDADAMSETRKLMESEVEISPVYCEKIPSHTELPTPILKSFVGFVVKDTEKLAVSRDMKKIDA